MIRRLLLVTLVAGAAAAAPGAASADSMLDQLIDASPGVDAVVVRAPEEISLSFRLPVESLRIRLFSDGDVASDGWATVDGVVATMAVDADGAGSYLVDWKGTGGDGSPISGAYVFLVDSRGSGSIAVEREAAGASGALGGLRVIAAGVAALAVVALLVGTFGWVRVGGADAPPRTIGIASLATVFGALAAGVTYGVPSDASPADLLDVSVLWSAASSTPGRAWLAAALVLGVMPFLLVLSRVVRSRLIGAATLVVCLVSLVWIAGGLGWLLRLPWLLIVGALVVAVVFWVSSTEGRPIGVAIAVVIGIVIAVPVVLTTGGTGTASAVQTGDLLLEASLDPARAGVNELHIYGFDVSGRGATLGGTTVVAYHRETDVGPLDLPVLRAGPNHFLSYHAILPLSGEWMLQIDAETSEGASQEATMGMELR